MSGALDERLAARPFILAGDVVMTTHGKDPRGP